MFKNILESIGNTPLIRLNSVNPHKNVEIYAKLESCNPGGSIKDRIALRMVEEAEKSGQLTKEKTIIEPTSGNTGIGLALVAAVKGYNIEIVMSESVTVERRKMLEAFGAKIILSPAAEGTDGAIKLAREMVRRSPQKYYMPDQFNNKENYLAHYHGTAGEIINQMPGLTHFVASLGTSGTIVGSSKRLKEYDPNIKTIAVEPVQGHKIQGLKNMNEAIVPGIYDESSYDEKLVVRDHEAYELARQLVSKEGIFAGMSSGAALWGALETAKNLKKGKIVVVFPDRGEKYLSTALFMRDRMHMKLFNTMSMQKEEFVPLVKGHVSMYSCGPTVYNYAHIGNFRSYMFADLLKRYLKYKGYKVTHVMNITDVDDKTIKGSMEEGKSLKDFTDFYVKSFLEDLDTLGIQRPDIMPRATETIREMVSLVKTLLEKGIAYKSDDNSIYYDISKFKDYGKLSHIKQENLKSGARVKQDEYDKHNASDFALWKSYSADDGDVYWETELGKGRPGWHIECSAMSMKYLGDNFDIHTGGIDLVFPHHENEISQSEGATGKTFVNYWVHCDHLIVDGKKMSKSLGNFYTLRDLIGKGYDAKAIRYSLLSTHYRQKLNFTLDGLEASKQSVERLVEFIRNLNAVKSEKENLGVKKLIAEARERFEQSMDDNLNISSALASIFDFIKEINKLMSEGRIGRKDACAIIDLMNSFDLVLGVMEVEEEELPDDIKQLIAERQEARSAKDFKKADAIRDDLLKKGIALDDTKDGVRWRKIS